MDTTAIAAIAAAVVALTQLLKWASWFPNDLAPLVVLISSFGGVALWVWSNTGEIGFYREHAFAYFAAGTIVATSAAGVFGFAKSVSGNALVSGTGDSK